MLTNRQTQNSGLGLETETKVVSIVVDLLLLEQREFALLGAMKTYDQKGLGRESGREGEREEVKGRRARWGYNER
jgi:hypothetical protein